MSDPVTSKAHASAPFIGWGLGLSVLGVPLLLASAYAEITADQSHLYPGDHPGMPLAVVGWVMVVAGAALLAIGAYFYAQHADRAAGVQHPTAPPERSWHEEKAAAAAAEAAAAGVSTSVENAAS